jgi:hypothetical protein
MDRTFVCDNNAASTDSCHRDHPLAFYYTHEELDVIVSASRAAWNAADELTEYSNIMEDCWDRFGPVNDYDSHQVDEFKAAEIATLLQPEPKVVEVVTPCACVSYEDVRPELNTLAALNKTLVPLVSFASQGPHHNLRWSGTASFLGQHYQTKSHVCKTEVQKEMAHLIMHHSAKHVVDEMSGVLINLFFESLSQARRDTIVWVEKNDHVQLSVSRSNHVWVTSYYSSFKEQNELMCKHAYNVQYFAYRMMTPTRELLDALSKYVSVRDWTPDSCMIYGSLGTTQMITPKDTIASDLLKVIRVLKGGYRHDVKPLVMFSHVEHVDLRSKAPFYVNGFHVQLLASCPTVATNLLRYEGQPTIQGVWKTLAAGHGLAYAAHVFSVFFGTHDLAKVVAVIAKPPVEGGFDYWTTRVLADVAEERVLKATAFEGDSPPPLGESDVLPVVAQRSYVAGYDSSDDEKEDDLAEKLILKVMPKGTMAPQTNTAIRQCLHSLYPNAIMTKTVLNRALHSSSKWGHVVKGKYRYWHQMYAKGVPSKEDGVDLMRRDFVAAGVPRGRGSVPITASRVHQIVVIMYPLQNLTLKDVKMILEAERHMWGFRMEGELKVWHHDYGSGKT